MYTQVDKQEGITLVKGTSVLWYLLLSAQIQVLHVDTIVLYAQIITIVWILASIRMLAVHQPTKFGAQVNKTV
jgi:hypothetical protein